MGIWGSAAANDPYGLGTVIARRLRGCDADGNRRLTQDQLEFARRQDLLPLLAWIVSNDLRAGVYPASVANMLARESRRSIAIELARRHHLQRLIEQLDLRTIAHVLLKGEALAHWLYPCSWTRPRADSDLLVRAASLPDVSALLDALGYRLTLGLPGGLTQRQQTWTLPDDRGNHAIDVHWHVTNTRAVDSALDIESVIAASEPLTGLSAAARRPSIADALLHACLHRVVHHGNSLRWLWLLDIHLLLEAADTATRECVIERAARHGVSAIIATGIQLSSDLYGTNDSDTWLNPLARNGTKQFEPSARLLRPMSRLRRFAFEIGSAQWREKFGLVRETAMPSTGYLRNRFPQHRHRNALRLHLKRWRNGWRSYFANAE